MHSLEELESDRDLWKDLKVIPAICSWCGNHFEVKYGTLYNVIRRRADGLYCCRTCSGAARAKATQERYLKKGGKTCKRCGEFKPLKDYSLLPNPPFYRAECKKCHNHKPMKQFNLYKEKALRAGLTFDLSPDNFIKFFNRNCFYCNDKVKTIRLVLIEVSKGYQFSNLVSSCRACQKFKSNLSHQEFIDFCQKIAENTEGDFNE